LEEMCQVALVASYGLVKTVVKSEYLSQGGRSFCRDLNRRPTEYDEGMLASRSWCSCRDPNPKFSYP